VVAAAPVTVGDLRAYDPKLLETKASQNLWLKQSASEQGRTHSDVNRNVQQSWTEAFHKKCGEGGNENPFGPPSINVMFSRRSSQTPGDEHGCQDEEWTYFVALKDVDTFEQAVARCSYILSYERSLIPGECARTKTVFARQRPSRYV
jgi:hypothetical protein